jgi:glycosyltransferase involved in cell wall biosynthesis
MAPPEPQVSVVIPTYQRVEQCKRAIASALAQELPPAEILVCDHGSTDDTQDVIESWATDEPLLRYLRLPENRGTPGPARNLGIETARGEWVAFLDDDDRWLPEKLRAQADALSAERYEVVASDARRVSGGAYFGLKAPVEPGRAELLRHNPIITSTAVIRRESLLAIGGFRPSRVEDYEAWLRLAYRGARFLVLPEELTLYEDTGDRRVSTAVARQEAEVAAVRWRIWLRHPTDGTALAASLRATLDAARHRFGRAASTNRG